MSAVGSPPSESVETGAHEIVPPDAGSMIESMRAFGYSTHAAVADLVDNSITAHARNVRIEFHWAGSASWVSILDDGDGMSGTELTEAMRLGGRNPREERAADDLGRFGLGLKTASFSQCRTLTVASRKQGNGASVVRRWDLDHVQSTGDWALLTTADRSTMEQFEPLERNSGGTLVLWQRADRMVGDDALEDERAQDRFLSTVRQVEAHLAMTFHRFLTGPGSVELWINDRRIEPWDPFLEGHGATQRLPAETLTIGGDHIEVAAYVLPHHAKLSKKAHTAAAGPGGWNAHQGFYIYRARRLLVAGGWLRLFQREEHCKLARIRVDLPNTLDSEWQIDVRKATARYPGALRADLKRIAEVTRKRATAVYRHRGKVIARAASRDHVFVWRQRLHRGKVGYVVNREHPLVLALLERDSDAEGVLRMIEETVPAAVIALDASERPDQQSLPFEVADEEEVRRMAEDIYPLVRRLGHSHEAAVEQLGTMEPFDRFPEILATLDDEDSR